MQKGHGQSHVIMKQHDTHRKLETVQYCLSVKLWGEVGELVHWGNHKGLSPRMNSEMGQPDTLSKRKLFQMGDDKF